MIEDYYNKDYNKVPDEPRYVADFTDYEKMDKKDADRAKADFARFAKEADDRRGKKKK